MKPLGFPLTATKYTNYSLQSIEEVAKFAANLSLSTMKQQRMKYTYNNN